MIDLDLLCASVQSQRPSPDHLTAARRRSLTKQWKTNGWKSVKRHGLTMPLQRITERKVKTQSSRERKKRVLLTTRSKCSARSPRETSVALSKKSITPGRTVSRFSSRILGIRARLIRIPRPPRRDLRRQTFDSRFCLRSRRVSLR